MKYITKCCNVQGKKPKVGVDSGLGHWSCPKCGDKCAVTAKKD